MPGGIVPLHRQPGPIATDRAAITNSGVAVSSGSVQIESGFQVTTASGQRTFDGPESLVLFGLTDATELRFTVPDYNFSALVSGFGDLALGVKQQIGHSQSGFDASPIAFVSFPTGANAVSSHGYDPASNCLGRRSFPKTGRRPECCRYIGRRSPAPETSQRKSTLLFESAAHRAVRRIRRIGGDFIERGGPRRPLDLSTAYKLGPLTRLISTSGQACLARPWITS
ncbi:MAG: transporter [Bryobacteraceae bacterium]